MSDVLTTTHFKCFNDRRTHANPRTKSKSSHSSPIFLTTHTPALVCSHRDYDNWSPLEVKVHESPNTSPAASGTRSPLGNFRKLKTLQANDNKFVFKVNDVSDNSSHILKETTCLQVAEKKR